MGSPNEFPYPLRGEKTHVRRIDAVCFFACRDRRPRRSGKQQILLFKRLLVCSHTQSKRFFFSDRRKAIAAGPYKV